jgi:soluble lytic murein transglycosylase-like protein
VALQKIDTCLVGTSPYSASIHAGKCTPGILRQFGVEQSRGGACRAFQGVAKLTFMVGIAAGVLFAWQGIALQVQKFSVRPDAVAPVTAMVRWVHNAWTAALNPTPIPQSTFAAEVRMSESQLMNRWTPMIAAASMRFAVPTNWIRAVVQIESGGRTMSGENKPITSHAGAMGLMQLMPGTYAQMRAQIGLGANPYNPHDNILAGAAYLRWLYQKYGYPAMFAAYNDGPGNLEQRLMRGRLFPQETRNYISRIFTSLNGGTRDSGVANFTRPNGQTVQIRVAEANAVRAPLPAEYPNDVQAVITVGHARQAVRETVDAVKAELSSHGAVALPLGNGSMKLADLMSSPAQPSHNKVAQPSRSKEPAKSDRRVERHVARAKFATARHRVQLADTNGSGAIHLHRLSHHNRSRGA